MVENLILLDDNTRSWILMEGSIQGDENIRNFELTMQEKSRVTLMCLNSINDASKSHPPLVIPKDGDHFSFQSIPKIKIVTVTRP